MLEIRGFPKPKRWQSKKWRDAAKGQPCTMRLPGCDGGGETTVLAHRNGAGMGAKASDHDGCDCCMSCHDAIDGRNHILGLSKQRITMEFNRARLETIINRLERGILK